jgi:hypothetical protein
LARRVGGSIDVRDIGHDLHSHIDIGVAGRYRFASLTVREVWRSNIT